MKAQTALLSLMATLTLSGLGLVVYGKGNGTIKRLEFADSEQLDTTFGQARNRVSKALGIEK